MAIAGAIGIIGANEIEDGAVTNDKLAGSIANDKLVNDSVIVNGTSIDLGASETITAGKILQVVNSIKTDTLSSAGAGAWNDIGLSVAITPSSTSSKIFVSVSVSGSLNNSNTWLKILRGTTDLGLGDAGSSRLRCTFGNLYQYGDANIMKTHSYQLLDSPSSTSELTYKVQVRSAANTYYINRSVNDTDSVDHGRASSSITLMEIAS